MSFRSGAARSAPPMSPLLDGVRVVDLSRVLAGPFGAWILAEAGAEVVKVEPPGGDPARTIGPSVGGRSLYFSSLNSGKRGVCLDLTTAEDSEVLQALLAEADIVVENFRPQAARKLGLEPDVLLTRHPRLVVVSVVGYSRSTGRGERAAFDLAIQAESGLMAVTGEPGREPVRAGVPLADLAAGMWAAFAAVAALLARERDGRGRHVEVPMLDGTLPLLSYMATTALATGVEPAKVGSGHHELCPYGAFPTSDGWVVVAVATDKFWPALCQALDLGGLAGRAELAQNGGRFAARREIDSAVATATAARSTVEAMEALERCGVPAAPVLGVIEALLAPYPTERGLVTSVEAVDARYSVVRSPVRTPRPLRPAPALGEHDAEVRAELAGL